MHAIACIRADGVYSWLARIVKAGWVIVAKDYSFAENGEPHPCIIDEDEACADPSEALQLAKNN
jgi:hypothetical protein